MTATRSRAAVSHLVIALVFGSSGCALLGSEVESTAIATSSVQPDVKSTTASAQQDALDAYVASAQAVIPQLMESAPGVYAEMQINGIDSDTVEFAYVYAEQLDAASAAEYFDGVAATLQATCDSVVIPEMEGAGITVDPKVRYTYYNADGSDVWERTFSRSS